MPVRDSFASTRFTLEVSGRLVGFFTGIDGLGSEQEFIGEGPVQDYRASRFAQNSPSRHRPPAIPPAPPVPLPSLGPMMFQRNVSPGTSSAPPIPMPYPTVGAVQEPLRSSEASPAELDKIFEDNSRTVGIRAVSIFDRMAMSILFAYYRESLSRGAPFLPLAIRAGSPERRYALRHARIVGWLFSPVEREAESRTVKPTQLKIFVCPSDSGGHGLGEVPRSFWPAREGGIAIETLEITHEGLV